jgi:hypothetical protein
MRGAYPDAVAYIYAFRHGDGQEFKIGRTANVEKRVKQLQTGNARSLTVFDVIETDYAKHGEAFLHERLAHKCLIGENFALTPGEVKDAMGQARSFLEQLPRRLELQNRVEELGTVESGNEMLPATPELVEQRRRLLQIRAEKAQRMADLEDLAREEERLEDSIKLAIGSARGIDGIATWRSRDGRRRFDSELLKAADPQLYEAYVLQVPKFETTRFKADDPEKYASYQVIRRERAFELVMDFGTE